jgi:hypothetical protein
MCKFILLTFLLSSFALASSGKFVCDLAQKHFPYAISKIESFEIDIDGNNHKDLFVTDSRGNAGAPYKVFLNKGKDYELIGEVFVHPLALQLIKNKKSSVHSLLAYVRDGADAGILVTYDYSGKEYLKVKSERILSSEFDKRITPAKTHVLEVVCK